MAHAAHENDTPIARFDATPKANATAIALILIGLGLFVAALFTDTDRAWHAYLFNWLYFLSISQGAMMVAVMVTITRGAWSRRLRRIALSFSAFLPFAFLGVIPLFFGASHIFPWLGDPNASPKAYLNLPFLVVRNVVLLAVLCQMSLLFAWWALRPDIGLVRNQVSGRLAAVYESMTRGWRGQEAEEALAHRRLAKLAPAIALVWAAAFSIVAWDFVMSLEAHWFSTLIGPYYFMAGLLGGLAATGIATLLITRKLGMPDAVSISQYHDLGKLTFGFVIFWGYLFFSQYIVIWYGLLPGEQSFVIHRFLAPFGIIAKLVFTLIFVVPFFGLLGATPKRTPRVLTMFGGIILTGLWFERYMLVYPSLHMGAADLPLGWPELGPLLLFGGLLVASISWFVRRFPIFQLWQPMSELELQGVNVQVAEAAGSAH